MPKAKTLYSAESKELTLWLRSERKRTELSIRQLAQKLGWASSIVGKIEQGERRLDVIEFMSYCNAMSVDPLEGISALKQSEKGRD